VFYEKVRDMLGFNSITLEEALKVACRLAEKKYLWCDRFAGEKQNEMLRSPDINKKKTTEEYLTNLEIYLDEACNEYAQTATVSQQQSKEITKLSVYIEFETNYKTLLEKRNTDLVDKKHRRKKEILKENSSSLSMTENKADRKAWDTAFEDFPLPEPDITISKLKELLPSCTK